MTTPSTPDGTKSVRIPPELHARLAAFQDSLPGVKSMADAIALLMTPQIVRIPVTPEQRARWEEQAKANGTPLHAFITARVEASLHYGADPGVLRRIHDMTYALTRAAGIVPQRSAAGDRQVIADRGGERRA